MSEGEATELEGQLGERLVADGRAVAVEELDAGQSGRMRGGGSHPVKGSLCLVLGRVAAWLATGGPGQARYRTCLQRELAQGPWAIVTVRAP